MIVIGCACSILRSPQTIDYCRTIVEDGRKDTYARNVMTMYKIGLVVALLGFILMLASTFLIINA